MNGPVAKWAERYGISRQAAYKRLKGHGIPVTRGRVDFDQADMIWAKSVNPLQQQRGAGRAAPATAAPAGPVRPILSAAPISSLSAAQLRRELVRLEKETLLLGEQKKLLVPVGEVNAWVSGMIIRAKDVLLRIGPELRDRLAQESNPIRCEDLVMAEVRRSLSELAEYRPNA